MIRIARGRQRLLLTSALSSAALLGALAIAGSAAALPVGGTGQVQFGQVAPTFSTAGATETVTLGSNRTIVNWTGYTVNGGETVLYNFAGLDAGRAIVFNRVITPGAAATINGSLYGRAGNLTTDPVAGNIWIYAPGSVVIGSGAVIDANGFLATTTDMTDVEKQNFLAVDGGGNPTNYALGFSGPAGGGPVTVASGATFNNINGVLAFIAPWVAAGANITGAASSDLVIGAAQNYTITLQDNGAGNQLSFVSFHVPNAAAGSGASSPVSVTGALSAGSIFVAAVNTSAVTNAVVNLGGTLTANGAEASNSGRIILTAGTDIANRTNGAATSGAGTTGITIAANDSANGRLYGVSNGDIIVNSGTTLTADANNNATIGAGQEDLRLTATGRLVGTGANFFATPAGAYSLHGGDVVLQGSSLTAGTVRGADVTIKTTSGAAEIASGQSSAPNGYMTVDAATDASISFLRQSSYYTGTPGNTVTIYARGGNATLDSANLFGGSLFIDAANNATLGNGGPIAAYTGVSVTTHTGDITLNGALTNNTWTGLTSPPSVAFNAARDIVVNAPLASQGQVNLTSGRDLDLASGQTIRADSNSSGAGADNLVVNAGRDVNASGGALLATDHGSAAGSSVYVTAAGGANINIIRGVQAHVTANGGDATIGAMGATGTTGGVNASVIASGAAAVSNLASGMDAQVYSSNGNAWLTNAAVTGNLTIGDSSAMNIAYLGGGTVGGALTMTGGSVLIGNPGVTASSASLQSWLGDVIVRGAFNTTAGPLAVNSARDADFGGPVSVAAAAAGRIDVTTGRDINIARNFSATDHINFTAGRDLNVLSGQRVRSDSDGDGGGYLEVTATGAVNAPGAELASMDPIGGSSAVGSNFVLIYARGAAGVNVNALRGAGVYVDAGAAATGPGGPVTIGAARARGGYVYVYGEGDVYVGNVASAAGGGFDGHVDITSHAGNATMPGAAYAGGAFTLTAANTATAGTVGANGITISGQNAVGSLLNSYGGDINVTASTGSTTVGAAQLFSSGNTISLQASNGQVIGGYIWNTGGPININGMSVDLAIAIATGAVTVTANNNIDVGNATGSSISITGGSVNNTGFLNATAGDATVRANNGDAAAGDVTATGNISVTATGTATARSTNAGGTVTVHGGS